MPGKPFQSKLEPFLELIREWRRQQWSYPRIAGALRKQHGVKVSPSTVFSYVKVRSRGRKIFALPATQQPPDSSVNENSPTQDFFEKPTRSKTHERKPYNLDF